MINVITVAWSAKTWKMGNLGWKEELEYKMKFVASNFLESHENDINY